MTAPQAFLDALARRDWERLATCFAPDVELRALIPPGVREAHTAGSAVELFRSWWAAADHFEMIGSEIAPISDRIRIGYRLRLSEGEWVLIEQQAYCKVSDRGIELMDLVCTGDRPA